jgi:hypothetical protein
VEEQVERLDPVAPVDRVDIAEAFVVTSAARAFPPSTVLIAMVEPCSTSDRRGMSQRARSGVSATPAWDRRARSAGGDDLPVVFDEIGERASDVTPTAFMGSSSVKRADHAQARSIQWP